MDFGKGTNNLIKNASTMHEVIAIGKDSDADPARLNFKVVIKKNGNEKIVMAYKSLLDRYFDELMDNTVMTSMSDSDFMRYKYNPRLFCSDVFDNVNLWSLILKINSMLTSIDFDKKTIRVPNSKFLSLLNEITIIEDDFFTLNREKINKEIGV